MAETASYAVPETRMPFVNAEFARIERAGKTALVTSVWGGPGNGRIYLIDPATGGCEMRRLPENEGGAYMLKTASDGRLYLGCGTGSLLRYDPRTDAFETLVKGQMAGLTWGGCVTDRHVVWAASPGHCCVYDWREGRLLHALKPLDPETPPALYGHRAVECPDGKVLVGMNCPQARLILLDPATGERRSVVPDAVRGQEWTWDATFFDRETLAVFCKTDLLFYRYPSFDPIGRAAGPADAERLGGRACFCRERFYALSYPDGSLWRLQQDRSGWEPVRSHFTGASGGILCSLDDRSVCAVGFTGEFFRWDAETGEVFSRVLDALGPLGVHAFCPAPETGKVFGAPFINQCFWEIDLAAGRGRDLGRAAEGGGQINGIVWDPATRRVLMASYTSCSVTAFDPEKPAKWPENPRTLARPGENQMRPKAFVHDGRHVWMASSAHYGHLGGALTRLDPRDGSVRVWRNLVKDQTPNTIVSDPSRRRVYVSTEIYADCNSAPATERTARLVAFDTEALAIAREAAPFDGCPSLQLLALIRPGRVLGKAKGRFFSWEPETDAIEDLGAAPPKGLAAFASAPDGSLYSAAEGRIVRVRVGKGCLELDTVAPETKPVAFLRAAGGRLWYVADQEVRSLTLE